MLTFIRLSLCSGIIHQDLAENWLNFFDSDKIEFNIIASDEIQPPTCHCMFID